MIIVILTNRRVVSGGSALNIQEMESSVAASTSIAKTTSGVNVLDLKSSKPPVSRCGRKDAP